MFHVNFWGCILESGKTPNILICPSSSADMLQPKHGIQYRCNNWLLYLKLKSILQNIHPWKDDSIHQFISINEWHNFPLFRCFGCILLMEEIPWAPSPFHISNIPWWTGLNPIFQSSKVVRTEITKTPRSWLAPVFSFDRMRVETIHSILCICHRSPSIHHMLYIYIKKYMQLCSCFVTRHLMLLTNRPNTPLPPTEADSL